MGKWWWDYQHSAIQGPLIPEVIHPDPATTILFYITRRAWRVVVLQTIRLQDGYSWRTTNRIVQSHGERVFVGDAQSRKVSLLHSYPFSESAAAVDRIVSTVYPLTRVYLEEGVGVLDGYSWTDYDTVSRTMPEAVNVADAYSRTLRDLITKTLPEAVGVADGYNDVQKNVSTKTMPEAVGVADDYTATEVTLTTVTLEEVVKVAEGGVLTPPPDPEYPDKTRYLYILGEKILIDDQIIYEVTLVLPMYEDIKVYPWAGTAVLDADPDYTYTAEVSEAGTSYVEVDHFDFNEDEADIKGIFVNLVWAQKITGSGSGKVKWQVASGSNASPGAYVDITDEVSETATDYNDHARSGVIHKITDFSSQMPITIRCLVKNVDATSAEAKIKSNSYIRAAYKRVE